MKALSVTDTEKLELIDIDAPEVKKGKVLVKVSYTGICGSDIPRYYDGAVHSFPQILGHEFSGVVEETGKSVDKVKRGNKVSIAPIVPCGECEYCQKGEPAMCTNYSFIGSRENGAMAEYVLVPEENCVVVPESLSIKEAALLEPLSVAIHGVDRVNVHAGATVMVLGTGTIGLMTILTLKAKGAGKIIAVDLNENKLSIAEECGATDIVNPSNIALEEYFNTHENPEIVYETAGSHVTQVQAIEFVKKRGKVVYIGTSTREITLNEKIFEKILRGELNITGSWMSYSEPFPGYEWRAGIRYMDSGQIDIKPLITGIYSLEDKELPFDKMTDKDSDQVKLLYEIAE